MTETIEIREKKKYEKRWTGDVLVGDSYRSASAIPFAHMLVQENLVGPNGRNLEIGCGDATTLKVLRDFGFRVLGSDITLAGCMYVKDVMEFPAWEIPMPDGFFGHTFSTDVLEHIPMRFIDNAIHEICRVTKIITTHQISTFPGTDHLTVKHMLWWEDQFRYWSNKYGIDYKLINRKK